MFYLGRKYSSAGRALLLQGDGLPLSVLRLTLIASSMKTLAKSEILFFSRPMTCLYLVSAEIKIAYCIGLIVLIISP